MCLQTQYLISLPPFGTRFNMPVLVNENIAAAQFMACSAGTHRDVIRMSGADYHVLVNPLVASFAVKDPAEAPAQLAVQSFAIGRATR